jgi:hypothetical protein
VTCSPTDRSDKKINKETSELNDTIDQIDFADICRIFYPVATEILLASHGTFSKIDHILGHKANLNKYKKIQIISCILPDHNGLKLEINSKINHRKYSDTWRLNNTLLNDQWIIRK